MSVVIGEVKPGFLADSKANGTLIPLPPQNGGAVGWGQVYLSFGSDFGDVTLRVAVYNHKTGAWRIDSSVVVPQKGNRVAVDVQDGDEKVSVGRVKTDDNDTGVYPCSYMIEVTLKA